MKKYVIFLRAVNVGGTKVMKMETLAKALEKDGFRDVRTHLNSGNIVLSSNSDKEMIRGSVNKILAREFGFTTEMIIKTGDELDKIMRMDPYAAGEDDFARRIVAMASAKIDETAGRPEFEENCYILGDLIYIYYHNGAGKSKFTNSFIEKKYKVIATSRNWNTLLKMRTIMEG